MQGLDWDDLRSFLAVSERGSISGAAKFLNVSHSTVLRRSQARKNRLGASAILVSFPIKEVNSHKGFMRRSG
jgi:DNA-binding transcriptional LysR family regulator